MSFKRAGDKKPGNFKRLGSLCESKEYTGVYLKLDPDCDLLYYDKMSKKYFKVLKIATKEPKKDSPAHVFLNCYVNLDNEKHVQYLGSDEE